MDSTPHPLQLRLLTQSKQLEVSWDDGTMTCHSFCSLRHACRCAECKSREKLNLPSIDDEVVLDEIIPIGQNAVQLCFSDGHRRGIYPFPYLRELGKS